MDVFELRLRGFLILVATLAIYLVVCGLGLASLVLALDAGAPGWAAWPLALVVGVATRLPLRRVLTWLTSPKGLDTSPRVTGR